MMKCEFIKLAQGAKIQLLNNTVGDGDYAILEEMYIMMDLDKKDFVKIVKAIGMETIIARHGPGRTYGKLKNTMNRS